MADDMMMDEGVEESVNDFTAVYDVVGQAEMEFAESGDFNAAIDMMIAELDMLRQPDDLGGLGLENQRPMLPKNAEY